MSEFTHRISRQHVTIVVDEIMAQEPASSQRFLARIDGIPHHALDTAPGKDFVIGYGNTPSCAVARLLECFWGVIDSPNPPDKTRRVPLSPPWGTVITR